MALLETKGLSKSFGGVQALQDVDVHIEEGSIHGLIGPNGSGKSTFFNVISGVYRPDTGSSVLFDNHEISQLPPHKITELGISRTFQLLRLFLEMTVLENVMVGYHCHTPYGFLSPILQGSKVREADEKIQDEMIEMLQFLGLASYANLPAGELSGGQRRLLSLGRAIAMKPKLLLLDEPGAGLSPV
ncbi:MAG: ABC transporter ATP-binding protein, partial [SAR324 cluster bacterium]|nr:ABC transporter ATP-binding protein [SAR324 cluster bacterium]